MDGIKHMNTNVITMAAIKVKKLPPKTGSVTIINGDYILPMAKFLKVADIQLYAQIHGEIKTKERFFPDSR